jgi:hypothetical protein
MRSSWIGWLRSEVVGFKGQAPKVNATALSCLLRLDKGFSGAEGHVILIANLGEVPGKIDLSAIPVPLHGYNYEVFHNFAGYWYSQGLNINGYVSSPVR